MGIDISALVIIAILGIPVFFLWRWAFRKITSTTRRRAIPWVVTIVTAPVFYAACILIFIEIEEYYPNKDFNKKEWLANKDIRYEYSHDLIKSKILIGKSKQQVLQLLGSDTDTTQNDQLEYDIGFRPEITGIDPSHIVVDFKNGKVSDVVEYDR